MLSDKQLEQLRQLAQQLCHDYGLRKAYFARCFGKRRQYLAGYGCDAFEQSGQCQLDNSLTLFWQGELSKNQVTVVKEQLNPIVAAIDQF